MRVSQHVRQRDPEPASAKWNAVVINVINYTCAFAARTCPNVCCEKPFEYSISVVADGPPATFSMLNSAVKLFPNPSFTHLFVSRRTQSVQSKNV